MVEILDKIISSYEGEVDELFWKYIYKFYRGGSSGGPESVVNGWIVTFIPYFHEERSPYADRSLKECMEQVDENDDQDKKNSYWDIEYEGVPEAALKESDTGINVTPFIMNYLTEKIPMKFISGFVGATITEDGYIMPQLGWGVVNDQNFQTS